MKPKLQWRPQGIRDAGHWAIHLVRKVAGTEWSLIKREAACYRWWLDAQLLEAPQSGFHHVPQTPDMVLQDSMLALLCLSLIWSDLFFLCSVHVSLLQNLKYFAPHVEYFNLKLCG